MITLCSLRWVGIDDEEIRLDNDDRVMIMMMVVLPTASLSHGILSAKHSKNGRS